MKKKIMIALAVFAAIGIGLYFYMYKGHRDIASENADFTVSVKELQQEFVKDNAAAGKKYADKTVEVSGRITDIDSPNHLVVLEQTLSVVFADSILPDVSRGKTLHLKGRIVGYDDLLEQVNMDQATLRE